MLFSPPIKTSLKQPGFLQVRAGGPSTRVESQRAKRDTLQISLSLSLSLSLSRSVSLYISLSISLSTSLTYSLTHKQPHFL